MTEINGLMNGSSKPPVMGDPTVKKKKSHDLAYLVIILAILFGAFLFVMTVVNNLLSSIP